MNRTRLRQTATRLRTAKLKLPRHAQDLVLGAYLAATKNRAFRDFVRQELGLRAAA